MMIIFSIQMAYVLTTVGIIVQELQQAQRLQYKKASVINRFMANQKVENHLQMT